MWRMQWIDLAKGMAIILVVYRHSIVGMIRSGIVVPPFLFNIQEYVYNFRMPVFFALSGIFLAKSLIKNEPKGLMFKKVVTLLYPYILWSFIFITLQIIFSDYTNATRSFIDYSYILMQPRNLDHMWYLLALFNTSILYLVVVNWWQPGKAIHIIFGVVLYLASYFIRDSSFFSDLFYHYIFFVLGAIFSELIFLNSTASIKTFLKGTIFMLPFFIFGQWAWQQLITDNFLLQIPFLLIIIIACIFFYFLCNLINSLGVFKFLILIGRNSLPIYILHLVSISLVRIISMNYFQVYNPYFILTVSVLMGLLIPVLVYKFGQPFGIEYLFTWGGKTPI